MTANNITNLVKDLEDYARSIFKCFANNQMQGNAIKCHILLIPNEKLLAKVDPAEIENSQSEKLSGVTTDSQLSFEKHINNSYDKVKAKLCYRILYLRHNSTIVL